MLCGVYELGRYTVNRPIDRDVESCLALRSDQANRKHFVCKCRCVSVGLPSIASSLIYE